MEAALTDFKDKFSIDFATPVSPYFRTNKLYQYFPLKRVLLNSKEEHSRNKFKFLHFFFLSIDLLCRL